MLNLKFILENEVKIHISTMHYWQIINYMSYFLVSFALVVDIKFFLKHILVIFAPGMTT